MDLLSEFEAETTVQLEVERVTGFEVGKAVFAVTLGIRISLHSDNLIGFNIVLKEVKMSVMKAIEWNIGRNSVETSTVRKLR